VRAAVDGVTSLVGANDGGEIDTLPVLMGNSLLLAVHLGRAFMIDVSLKYYYATYVSLFIKLVKSVT
jgi:hypothetical protein